ncbi:MAG: MarC family NAAT transporter [Chitinophagales bacterium]
MNAILGIFTALFSVVNPLGAVPLFLSLTEQHSDNLRKKEAFKACVYFALILITFLMLGTYILSFFGITIDSMRIAGGLIIVRSGYNLMGGTYKKGRAINKEMEAEAIEKEDISFSPLAMPMLAGPGSISLLISMSTQSTNYATYFHILIAILMLGIVTYFIFLFSPKLFNLLGRSGISALSRIMGFIVITIGIQFIVSGTTNIISDLLKLNV